MIGNFFSEHVSTEEKLVYHRIQDIEAEKMKKGIRNKNNIIANLLCAECIVYPSLELNQDEYNWVALTIFKFKLRNKVK